MPSPPCHSGLCHHPKIWALPPAQVSPTSTLVFGTARTRAPKPSLPEMPTSPKSYSLGPLFYPLRHSTQWVSSPHSVPPFLQVYSPCLWWVIKKAKPRKIWKFLRSKFGLGSINKSLQRTASTKGVCVFQPWISLLGLAEHSSAGLPMPPASFSTPFIPETRVLAPASPPLLSCLPPLHLILSDQVSSRLLTRQACRECR